MVMRADARGRAAPGRPAPSQTSAAAKQAEVFSVPRLQQHPGAAGELAAWGAAVLHLHSLGLPAAVPAFPAAWLARRGIRADWVTAA
jgi:hypothetical protein